MYAIYWRGALQLSGHSMHDEYAGSTIRSRSKGMRKMAAGLLSLLLSQGLLWLSAAQIS